MVAVAFYLCRFVALNPRARIQRNETPRTSSAGSRLQATVKRVLSRVNRLGLEVFCNLPQLYRSNWRGSGELQEIQTHRFGQCRDPRKQFGVDTRGPIYKCNHPIRYDGQFTVDLIFINLSKKTCLKI